jgi:murein DD-endopeptidase MepM/ murein hydrolase activator NlpD
MRNIVKSCFLAFMLVFSSQLMAQTEHPTCKIVAEQFEKKYNAGDYDGIFAMLDANMQSKLPKDFLNNVSVGFGKIKKREFVKNKDAANVYKTEFDNQIAMLMVSVDASSKINGLYIKPFQDDTTPKIERNTTKMILPFNGTWDIVWGGDTKELNYHVEYAAQKGAFDIVIFDKKGKSYKKNGKKNEDYYAFGKELIAPCDGEIVALIDGIADNIPGVTDAKNTAGNMVVIKTVNNEYVFLCHFKNQSIKVKKGDKVKQKQLLGLCGNSGNSSEAHLHFHIQNTENLINGTGAKCYFDKIYVNGNLKTDYSPIQKEKVSNEK